MAFTHFQNYELCWIKNWTCMLWNIIVSWTWYRLDRWNVMANDKSMCQPQLFIIWVIFHFHRCWLCVMNFQYIKVVCWGCKCVDQRGEQHTPLHSLVCIITPVFRFYISHVQNTSCRWLQPSTTFCQAGVGCELWVYFQPLTDANIMLYEPILWFSDIFIWLIVLLSTLNHW